jgi:hypothetical protein
VQTSAEITPVVPSASCSKAADSPEISSAAEPPG